MTDKNQNLVNEDAGPVGFVGPKRDNSAKENQKVTTEGTAITDSPNLEGSGNAQSNANTKSTDAPGRRLKNPLGNLSSYTYQLSLYMITPDAYDAFQASGRTEINALSNATEKQVQIVAEPF